MYRASAAAAGLALILGLAACGGGGGGSGPGETELHLTIGNSMPLSGNSRSLGESGGKASELALDRIKQAVASAGADHTVRIVNDDQGSDANSAVASARKLVDADGASCLTGPWSSGAVAQVANDVSIPAKVVQVVPVAVGDDVAELSDHDLVVSTALPVSLEGDALAKAIEGDLGTAHGHTVNVAARDDDYGRTVSQGFVAAWQDRDGSVVGPTVLPPVPPSSPSGTSGISPTSPQIPQITGVGASAVLLVDDPAGFAELGPALAGSGGWDPSMAWGSDRLVSPGLPSEVAADSIDNLRALAPGAPSDHVPTAAFVQAFQSAAPRNVKLAPYAAQQFDATILCYLAAVAAGSTDGQKMADKLIDITAPGGTEYSWQQLPQAVKALEAGEDIDYTGASGPLDMDVHGNPTDGVFAIYQYVRGKLQVVGEIPVEKPNPATP